MGTSLASVVDWHALLLVVLYSSSIGVGVTLAFSLAIMGATRFVELRQDGRLIAAGAFAVIAVIGFAVSAGAIVLGIYDLVSR